MGNAEGSLHLVVQNKPKPTNTNTNYNNIFTFKPTDTKRGSVHLNKKTNNNSLSITVSSQLNKQLNSKAAIKNVYQLLALVDFLKLNMKKTKPSLYHSTCINKLSQCVLKEEKNFLAKEIQLVEQYTEDMLKLHRNNEEEYKLLGGIAPIKKIQTKRNFYDFDNDITLNWDKTFAKNGTFKLVNNDSFSKQRKSYKSIFNKKSKPVKKKAKPEEKKKLVIRLDMPKILTRLGYIKTGSLTTASSTSLKIQSKQSLQKENNDIVNSMSNNNIKEKSPREQFKKVQFAINESLSMSHSTINNNVPSCTNTKSEISNSSIETINIRAKQ